MIVRGGLLLLVPFHCCQWIGFNFWYKNSQNDSANAEPSTISRSFILPAFLNLFFPVCIPLTPPDMRWMVMAAVIRSTCNLPAATFERAIMCIWCFILLFFSLCTVSGTPAFFFLLFFLLLHRVCPIAAVKRVLRTKVSINPDPSSSKPLAAGNPMLCGTAPASTSLQHSPVVNWLPN